LVDTGKARHALAWTGSEQSGLYHVAFRDGANVERLTRLGSDDARNADMVATPDGVLVAVWDEASRDGARIFRARSVDGIVWDKPDALSPPKSESSFPRILVSRKGEAVFWLEGSMRTGASLFVNGKALSQ
jgi:hypothetical protein